MARVMAPVELAKSNGGRSLSDVPYANRCCRHFLQCHRLGSQGRAIPVGVPAVAHPFSASLYSPCHHFIFGIWETALSSIITSSSC
jgi:hypothetical protein